MKEGRRCIPSSDEIWGLLLLLDFCTLMSTETRNRKETLLEPPVCSAPVIHNPKKFYLFQCADVGIQNMVNTSLLCSQDPVGISFASKHLVKCGHSL